MADDSKRREVKRSWDPTDSICQSDVIERPDGNGEDRDTSPHPSVADSFDAPGKQDGDGRQESLGISFLPFVGDQG